MFSSTSLCSEQQLSGILIRELEDEFEPSFEFGLLGLLTEVLASNADGTRGLVDVLMFRRESRLLDCGDFLLPSLLPGLDLGLGQGGRGIGYSIVLLHEWFFGENKEIINIYIW